MRWSSMPGASPQVRAPGLDRAHAIQAGLPALVWCFNRLSALRRMGWRLGVVQSQPRPGADRRLADLQRPLTHGGLLYLIQRPLGRIA
jgi:hypothetical protein